MTSSSSYYFKNNLLTAFVVIIKPPIPSKRPVLHALNTENSEIAPCPGSLIMLNPLMIRRTPTIIITTQIVFFFNTSLAMP